MMKGRALTLLALTAMLVVAFGAMPQAVWGGDGFSTRVVTFAPGSVDTVNFLDGAAAVVNDSLIFYSDPFTVNEPWTVCKMRLFAETADTVSTIDTIGYAIQSKFGSRFDSTWWTIGTNAKAEEDKINTTPVSMTSTAWFDADSVGIGDLFRIKFALVATQAEWRLADQRGVGAAKNGTIKFNAKYVLYMIFVHKGNQ